MNERADASFVKLQQLHSPLRSYIPKHDEPLSLSLSLSNEARQHRESVGEGWPTELPDRAPRPGL